MARFSDFNIRLKFIIAFIFVFLVSIGVAILLHNAEYKGKKLRETAQNIYILQNKILKIQNKVSELDVLAYKIDNETQKQNLYIHQKELDQLKKDIEKLLQPDDQELTNLHNFDVSLLEYDIEDTLNLYKNNIYAAITAVEQMLKYKDITLSEDVIRREYKKMIAQFENLQIKYEAELSDSLVNETVIRDIKREYEKELARQRLFVIEKTNAIKRSSQVLVNIFDTGIAGMLGQINNIYKRNVIISGIIFILSILLIFGSSIFFVYSIERPLQDIIETLEELSRGKLPNFEPHERDDELGLISDALHRLLVGLRITSEFATELGKGNFDYKYTPLSGEDTLGNSLIEMRRSLIQAAKEEAKRKKEDFIRNRSAEAMALFADILRRSQGDLNKLGDDVIINLVRFFNANQGVFFILNDKNPDHVFLRLLSAYAWNRKKYLEKYIELGEGLIGSVAIEKFTVYMTDVPEDYIEIRSGTGDANPTSILIVPVKTDEEVLGVIEIASFKEFEPYEIELIERIAESIAATLKTVKINEQTTELLEKFQIQTAEMREQEMIMRQTINELKKTQEETKRKEKELQQTLKDLEELNKQLKYKDEQLKLEVERLRKENEDKIKEIIKHKQLSESIIEAALLSILRINEKGLIDFANPSALELLGYTSDEIKNKKLEDIFYLVENIEESLFERFKKRLDEFKKSGGKTLKIKTKLGEIKDVLVDVIMTQQTGELIIFIKDLTLIKQQEAEEAKTMEDFIRKELECIVKTEKLMELLKKNNITPPKLDLDDKILIRWGDRFKLGIEVIDKQHKKWIDFINKLYELLQKKEATEHLDRIFKDLIDYTNYHFGFEEKYMKDFKLDIFESHKKKHKDFVEGLFELYNEYTSRKVDTPYKLVLFLKKWVEKHVLIEDRKYVEDFKKHGIK